MVVLEDVVSARRRRSLVSLGGERQTLRLG